jgi:hypothetical protein
MLAPAISATIDAGPRVGSSKPVAIQAAMIASRIPAAMNVGPERGTSGVAPGFGATGGVPAGSLGDGDTG